MKQPNFFIVGAPKSGTTALYEYLRFHPNVFMPPPSRKEPHFFATDMPGKLNIGPQNDYRRLFKDADVEHTAVGEASVFYMYSEVAISSIHEFDPGARLIAMLRNPVDAAYSYHSQALNSGNEDETDFGKAWRLQEIRETGQAIPRTCQAPQVLQYRKLFLLGQQVRRLQSVFPADQVKLIVFDDFVNDTRAVYEDVLSFLGVPGDGRADFPRINENAQDRVAWLSRLILHPPAVIKRPVFRVMKVLGMNDLGIDSMLLSLNRRPVARPALDASLREEIAGSFREDVAELSRVVDRDLSGWLGRAAWGGGCGPDRSGRSDRSDPSESS